MARILIQTTIPPTPDDWHVGRFSLLAEHLRGLGHAVTARDHQPGADPVLLNLADSDFDQLWLLAVDVGDGLSDAESAAIRAFHARGGGVMVTRDHQDLGSSVRALGALGRAHHFHTVNPEADPARCCRDDQDTAYIDWPNYHSGANGDFQVVKAEVEGHPLLAETPFLPAHPHEGAISAPPGARVIATGVSAVSGARFNLIVAFEGEGGRAVAQSTFHHFADYNLDPRAGCPSFVSEAPSDRILTDPRGRRAAERYFQNLAEWLSP
ncbi:hypothetical protein ASE17_10205 [Phenylobacterium sp. Root77]|uniref:hypothetical protein n=1 Tax=unclassified Phenylobacterium TaxID=2640670 RepID=UPI0006FB397A|nr:MULTISPECIES: hypothetical protein [unclassified Phenylobacterium]KQW73294.1 hypothetical protein ASC73_02775 [Phenylobacterium sp. Root1277]KQW92514.1 hypothetical protein ASC79_13485 [Phenylobacterium sp. Root1290]KRC40743.1 hypothetical protein ASE17_10205 [Phenylobacterium sp. Root77]